MNNIILSNDRGKRLAQIREKFYMDLPKNKRESIVVAKLEVRADPDAVEGSMSIQGYGAVFDLESDGLWFIEKIEKGAFLESIDQDDIRGLFNHDRNFILARNTAGTMSLEEDDTGLLYKMDLPDTQIARDLFKSIERLDVTGSSFSFVTQKDEWEYLDDGETVIRTLKKVKLFDVGPVTFPAYPDTTTAVRSMNDWIDEQKTAAGKVPWRREIARRRLELAALN